MGFFTNRVTQVLGNVFNFRDGRSNISSVDLTGPLQPVIDLSRGAGLAKSTDWGTSLGLFGLKLDMVHAGAGAVFNEALDIYAVEAEFTNVPVDQQWIWVMDIEAFSDTDIQHSVIASVIDDQIAGTPVVGGTGRLLWRGNTLTASLPFEAAGSFGIFDDGAPSAKVTFPYLLTPGVDLQVASTASAAATVSVIWRMWLGARFVMPPGLG